MLAWQSLCALTLLALCGIASVSSECLKQGDDFSKYKDGHKYHKDDVAKKWGDHKGPYKMIGGGGGSALTTIDGGAIRGSFRKGKISGYDTGFTWYAMNEKQYEEASMSYMVKFSPGFEWTKGGKLPGLCGGEGKTPQGKVAACPVGCSEVSRDRGFSTRLMWRSGGAVVTYAYYPDKPKSIRCGEDWKWSKKFQTGKWHHIRMWAKLNTPGKANGEYKAWLDGEQVLYRTKIPYRYNGSFKISRSYITTYAGGSSVSMFAPNKNQYIWFKDFQTWSGGGDSTCSSNGGSPTPSVTARPSPSPSPSTSGGTVTLKGHGTKWASKDVSGYVLVPEEAGWDVPGNIGKQAATSERWASDRDRVVQRTLSCIKACNKISGCAGFGLNVDTCWFKDSRMVSATPQYKGESADGWRWLYVKQDAVTDQSGAPDGEQPEIKLALNTYQILNQSSCGSLTQLRPEDCSNGNWVVTVQWAEEVQGHRLKWWGMDVIDKQDQVATFNPTEESTGLCFYWNASEENVTQQQIDSWITATAVCESA